MARWLLFGFLLVPFWGSSQVVDTAAVRVEVDSLIKVCRSLTEQRKYEDALQIIEEAKKKALKTFGAESVRYASCTFNEGRVFYFMRKYGEAEPLYLEALAIQEKVLGREHPDYAYSLNSLAVLYYKEGAYDKAEPLYWETKTIREKIFGKEHPEYAKSLNSLANLFSEKGEYDKAEPLYLESKAIREKTLGKEHPDYAAALNNLAVLYFRKGEYDKAEPLYLEAKNIREKGLGKEHPEYASSIENLANLYATKGEYDKAEPLYLETKAIREKVLGKEHPDYAKILNNLAVLYRDRGEYEKAEQLYLETKAIREKVLGKEHPDYAKILNNLAVLYMDKGEYDKAETIFVETKAIREKVLGKEHPDYAKTLNNLAMLYDLIGEYEKSESLYLETIDIQGKVLGKGHPDYATNLDNLGILYKRIREYDKAESLYLKAIAIREKAFGKEHQIYAISLSNLAILYEVKGQYSKAEPLYLDTKTILENRLGKEHPNYAQCLNNLAIFYMVKGDYDKAHSAFIKVALIHKHILKSSVKYLPSQELEKYITFYQDENDAFYSFNHQTTSDSLRIQSYNNALFYKGFALETASRLEQVMQSAPDSIRDLHSRWKGYNRLLAAELSKPIAERTHAVYLDSMSNVLEKVLLRATPALAEAQRQVEWQEVRDALQPGEAAIEFIHYRYSDKKLTDSTMYSALLTLPGGNAPIFIPLCEARQLDTLISTRSGSRANYLQNLYASPRADGLASLKELLWEPIEKRLLEQGIQTVYYSPTGLLHRINLSAISEGKSGVPLAEHYHLVPMGSTRLLAERPKAKQLAGNKSPETPIQLKDALIYGGVRYEMDSSAISSANDKIKAIAQDTTGGLFGFAMSPEKQRGDNWEYLPGTEKEARYLDSLLRSRGTNTTLRLDYQATEESFKQIGQNGPSPSLLHIGTHGFFFPDSKGRATFNGEEPIFKISEYSMIRSGLKLAGAKYAWENGHPLPGGHEDGILTAYEVSQMNLSNTQLVVLSACETGLGDIRGNEGVYGLQRAFRIAGAKNVLMSLWKVPDDATKMLMTRFYSNWQAEKKPLRASFEEAQQWLRGQKGYENPYYWAGFVLV